MRGGARLNLVMVSLYPCAYLFICQHFVLVEIVLDCTLKVIIHIDYITGSEISFISSIVTHCSTTLPSFQTMDV